MKKILALIVFLALSNLLNAQWQPDVRLTSNVGSSYTSYNRPCITANGDVLHIVWHDDRDGNAEVYYKRSTDAGTTWGTDIRLTNNSANSEFPTIAVLGLNVYVVWQDGRDTTNEIYLKKSTDAGITWSADTRITFAPAESNFPIIAVSGSILHVAWHDYRNSSEPEIYYKRSTDAGASWSADVRMTVSAGVSAFPLLSISDSTVHLIWQDNRYGQGEIYYARSSNNGVNWSTEVRLTIDVGISAYPTVSSLGFTVHLAWWDSRSFGYEIYYKKSTDDGLNWGTDTKLTNSAGSAYDPFIYASGTLVHIVWVDTRDGNYEIYYKGSSDAGANWSDDYRITNNSAASEGNSMIAYGPKVHVLWQDNRDGNSEIYYKQNPIGNTIAAVDSVSPENKINLHLSSDMKAYFNQNMNGSTTDSNSIIFFGSMTGRKQGTYTYSSGEKSVTINPINDFKYGELISTTLTSSIKTSSDNFIAPFVWSFTTLAMPSNLVFNQTGTVGVGAFPWGITTGDFDGDGYLDLSVANSASNTVSILMNNGTGIFSVSSSIVVGGTPSDITIGDYDGDGDLDLVTTNYNLNTVSILKNSGTGVFSISSSVGVGLNPDGITTGDFNGDGDLDMAVVNLGSNNISILRNDGTGNFSLLYNIDVGSGPRETAAGDFDGDGDLDLAVTNQASNTVSILKNDGTGNFPDSSLLVSGTGTYGITTGDLDGDGDLDLAVTNIGPNTVSILKNDGTGTFSLSSSVGVGSNPHFVTTGDLDGDGDLDLAVTNQFSNIIIILKNNGTGAFSTSSSVGVGSQPFGITAGDFNNDGVLDLANVNGGSNSVTITMNLVPPQLLTPANNSIGNLNVLSFSWNKSIGASNYKFQLALDSLFSSILINDSTLSGTDSVKAVSGLNALTWYYWRLNSKSTNGTSLWSDTWKFKTLGIPFSVNLIFPPNNAVNQPTSIQFRWDRATEQTNPFMNIGSQELNKKEVSKISEKPEANIETISNYWLELVTDTVSMANLLRDTTLTDTTKSVSGLSNLTAYFWRVRAKNEIGWGNFSAWWRFTTIVAVPSIPILVSPLNYAANVPVPVTFIWNASSFAETYSLQVSSDSLFSTIIYSDSTLTDTSKTVSSLPQPALLFWRVKAKNIAGTNVSSVWRFTTEPLFPTLTLKVYLEGFYSPEPLDNLDGLSKKAIKSIDVGNENLSLSQVSDTVNIYLADSTQNYLFKDSVKVILTNAGTVTTPFANVTTGKYYIVVRHRNHLESWSKYAVSFTGGSTTSYDFTTSAGQAYGDNMKQVGSVWVLYGGDPNQDGDIGALDIPIFISQFGTQGYLSCDFNGDDDVTGVDQQILIQNFGITTARPSSLILSPGNRKSLQEFQKRIIEKKNNN